MASNKSDKIEFRCRPEFKEAVQTAATAANLSMAAFAMAALIEKMYGIKPAQRARDGE